MRELICRAIRQRRLLHFYYGKHPRTVEPYLVGTTTAGNEALRAYQVSTGSESGDAPGIHLFLLSELKFPTITERAFLPRVDKTKHGDKQMSTIYCEL